MQHKSWLMKQEWKHLALRSYGILRALSCKHPCVPQIRKLQGRSQRDNFPFACGKPKLEVPSIIQLTKHLAAAASSVFDSFPVDSFTIISFVKKLRPYNVTCSLQVKYSLQHLPQPSPSSPTDSKAVSPSQWGWRQTLAPCFLMCMCFEGVAPCLLHRLVWCAVGILVTHGVQHIPLIYFRIYQGIILMSGNGPSCQQACYQSQTYTWWLL